jgi:hypothetical protein
MGQGATNVAVERRFATVGHRCVHVVHSAFCSSFKAASLRSRRSYRLASAVRLCHVYRVGPNFSLASNPEQPSGRET